MEKVRERGRARGMGKQIRDAEGTEGRVEHG